MSVVRLIEQAKHSIRVAAYSFTPKDIAAALLQAHKRGVDVQMVLDRSNTICVMPKPLISAIACSHIFGYNCRFVVRQSLKMSRNS